MTERAAALGIIKYSRQSVAGSLAETDIAGNDRVKHHFAKMALELLVNLIGKTKTCIVHSEEKPLYLK